MCRTRRPATPCRGARSTGHWGRQGAARLPPRHYVANQRQDRSRRRSRCAGRPGCRSIPPSTLLRAWGLLWDARLGRGRSYGGAADINGATTILPRWLNRRLTMTPSGLVKWAAFAEPMRLDRVRQSAVAGGINARSGRATGAGGNSDGRQTRGVSSTDNFEEKPQNFYPAQKSCPKCADDFLQTRSAQVYCPPCTRSYQAAYRAALEEEQAGARLMSRHRKSRPSL